MDLHHRDAVMDYPGARLGLSPALTSVLFHGMGIKEGYRLDSGTFALIKLRQYAFIYQL